MLSEEAAIGAERLPELLGKDSNKGAQEIIINADILLTCIEQKLEHLGGRSTTSLSLSLVPLIYWYNRKGSFVRALLYGWMQWLLTGTEAEVKERKIALSSVRGELEETLIRFKDEFADIQHRGGAGLKSLAAIVNLLQSLVETLLQERSSTSEIKDGKLRELFGVKIATTATKNSAGRSFSKTSRAEINVRELLGSSLRCEICGGVVDLKQGVQYDHKEMYALGGSSTPDNGRPTHPFCNLFRDRITNLRFGHETHKLPRLSDAGQGEKNYKQLALFDAFPGE